MTTVSAANRQSCINRKHVYIHQHGDVFRSRRLKRATPFIPFTLPYKSDTLFCCLFSLLQLSHSHFVATFEKVSVNITNDNASILIRAIIKNGLNANNSQQLVRGYESAVPSSAQQNVYSNALLLEY